MIKFFRHIRRSLINENRMGKYFKYALGEILLVVIGILMALQINNWNENRKVKANEITILKQLNADLKKNLEEIDEVKSIIVLSEEASKDFLLFLNSNKIETDSMSGWLNQVGRSPIFNNANTTYKNLENSSNRIISNDSLRLRITLMYEREFKNIDVRDNVFKTQFNPEFKKHHKENFTMTSEVSENGEDIFFTYNKPKNIVSLKQNDDFKNALVDMHNFLNIRIFYLTTTQQRLRTLITDIEQEIVRLK